MRQSLNFKDCQLSFTVRGSGPPVVFIQGVGVHGDGWLPQIEQGSARYTCLSIDNRGMGLSQPCSGALTVVQMAEDTLAIMDYLGWDTAHIVGHSLGGLIALCIALQSRQRVRSLALLCTFADGRKAAPLTLRMMWLGMRSQLGTRTMRRKGFLRLVMPADSMKNVDCEKLGKDLEPLFGHDLGDQPAVVSQQLKSMRGANYSGRLGELSGIPTLVVSASEDPIAPPALGRAMAEAIPGARYVELAGRSHGVPIQDPAAVNSLLCEHLSQSELVADLSS